MKEGIGRFQVWIQDFAKGASIKKSRDTTARVMSTRMRRGKKEAILTNLAQSLLRQLRLLSLSHSVVDWSRLGQIVVAGATFTFFTSLLGGIKTKKLSEFHQISKLWDFRPQEQLT